jgi:hypothetical protein
MDTSGADSSFNERSGNRETVYDCEKHGIMNKPIDLKEKVDTIAKRT